MPRKPYIMPPEQIIKANARSNAYNKKCRQEAKAWRELMEHINAGVQSGDWPAFIRSIGINNQIEATHERT